MPEVSLTHPSDQQLTDYGLGKLSPHELSWIDDHLTRCPECLQRVENPPADSFVGRLRAAAPHLEGSTPLPPRTPNRPPQAGLPRELLDSTKYQVLEKIGQGGMGSVWKARHAFLDCLVAIKVLDHDIRRDPAARTRFLKEMRAVGKLRHPNVVRAIDAEQVGDALVLVMEYVDGTSLEKLVAQKGPLSVPEACSTIAQAAEGLQHAHEQGIAHRDVKPHNLMRTGQGEVKVLDFGLARIPRGSNSLGSPTQFQIFLGTPEYVAPEQASNARKADIRSDIYSLGCTLYFLLAGRPPYRGSTILDTVLAHVQDVPRPLEQVRPDVPPALAAVVARMMAREKQDRFQTPREVADALRPFLSAQPETTPSPNLPPPVPRPSRRRERLRPILLGMGAMLLGVLCTLILLKFPTPDGGLVEVEIRIDQPDCKVSLDGKTLEIRIPGEMKPITVRVEVGKEHQLRVEKDGFETITREFIYRKGKAEIVNVVLTARPPVLRPVSPPPAPPGPPPGPQAAPPAPARIPVVHNGAGKWIRNKEGHLEQTEPRAICPQILFGNDAWKDYDLRYEFRIAPGGMQIGGIFRATGLDQKYLFLQGTSRFPNDMAQEDHPGGWSYIGHHRHAGLQTEKWYSVRVELRGKRFTCFLDGEKRIETTNDRNPAGRIGFRTWAARCSFRSIRVTDPDGKVLLDGIDQLDLPGP